jgi:hypothetical protein
VLASSDSKEEVTKRRTDSIDRHYLRTEEAKQLRLSQKAKDEKYDLALLK